MHRLITRLSLLILCVLATGQPARASLCRHVDRLVMPAEAPSFWEDAGQPAWESATGDHSAAGWTTTCHKPAGGGHGKSFVQPIVADESTDPEFRPDPSISANLLFNISPDSIPEPAPRPRPPRAV